MCQSKTTYSYLLYQGCHHRALTLPGVVTPNPLQSWLLSLILNLFNTHQSENIHWHYVGSPKNRSYHSVFFVLLVLEGNCSIIQISEYSFSSILLWLPVVWIVGIRDFFPGAVTAALQVAVAALPWDHLPDAYLDGHCWTMQISWSSSNYTDSCRSRI